MLRYESLVSDPAEETRKLLDYVGLPFEENCLRFYETRRRAPTPSLTHVSGKLDDRSIDRHEHYARYLQPYVARLSRIMGAYGYS